MNPFKSKIYCTKCNKKYRRKMEKGVEKFICGGYSKGIGCTERIVIKGEFIRDLINRRYERVLTDEELEQVVERIDITDEIIMDIHFTDDQDPILLQGSFIQF
ncbi:hypothetical protein FZC83_02480 [Rossellomorea marisflavi]|uniref:Recombinase zinc beta ribbon domain-containing protein n=1 Tax=Rossellomorea marisflavi TaxID=189381 RepID=A0A5D4S0J5_9BACI|nr:hypothetical protein [Rossellomorea marisflavi]TYS56459.1 hypothetical protein FZC83_02480 [Rossellomorea marisflavi]